MDWDNRTQTGARTSGVEELTPRMAVRHCAHGPDTVQGRTWSYRVHEGQMQIYVARRACLVLA
jgi:hypothetical protein